MKIHSEIDTSIEILLITLKSMKINVNLIDSNNTLHFYVEFESNFIQLAL